MTLAGIIQSSIDILKQIQLKQEKSRIGADSVLYDYFRTHRYIGSHDRKEISRLIWEILRKKILITHLFDGFEARQAMLYYLRYVEGNSEETILEIFSGAKYAPYPLSDEEKSFISSFKEPTLPKWVELNTPEWLYEKLVKIYGENVEKELNAFSNPAEIDIIINPQKTTREAMLDKFFELNVKAEATPISPLGIRIFQRTNLTSMHEFQNGFFEIQDESSQVLSFVAANAWQAKEADILDYCSGAGGKTLGLAFFMGEKASITSTDLFSARLKEARSRFWRAGIEPQTKILKITDLPKKHGAESFDIVVVDAPCSCLGTMRRAPDIRWRTTEKDVTASVATQKQILDEVAGYVKDGGLLIYATCSILVEENEGQVDDFLSRHKSFAPFKIELEKMKSFSDNSFSFRLSPASSGSDGFFVAVLKKEES